MIPGFADAVEGIRAGESRTATIPAAEAYGARTEELVLSVPGGDLTFDVELVEVA